MKINMNADSTQRFDLEQALKMDEGTMFRAYNHSGRMAALAIRGRCSETGDPVMVQLYEPGGSCIVFSQNPTFPFTFELLSTGYSVTLVQ